jgi:hypothetical protein
MNAAIMADGLPSASGRMLRDFHGRDDVPGYLLKGAISLGTPEGKCPGNMNVTDRRGVEIIKKADRL